MKWAYLDREGKPVYQEIQGKIDFYCSATPQVTLMLFKCEGNWIVAEHLTGIKLGAYPRKALAKAQAFKPETALSVTTTFALHKRQGRVYPPINEVKPKIENI